MHCRNVDLRSVKLLFQLVNLIPVRCDHADLCICSRNTRQNILFDHVDLPLIHPVSFMLPWDCQHQFECFFPMIRCHDDQLVVIKFLIAKPNDQRMTSVVFSQDYSRDPVFHQRKKRFQKTVLRKIVCIFNVILFKKFLKMLLLAWCNNIWQLLGISNDHCISCTGKCQTSGGHIHLRRLVHHNIVKPGILSQTASCRVGRTQHDRVFLKNIPRRFPKSLLGEHRTLGLFAVSLSKVCTETTQGHFRKFIHQKICIYTLQLFFQCLDLTV